MTRSEAAFKKSLAIRETTEGLNSSEVASNLNYVAMAISDQGRVEEAEALYRQSAVIFGTRNSDDDKHEYAKPLNNLGNLLIGKGSLDEGKSLLRKALKLNEESITADHPKTLICLVNLASALTGKNEKDEAESLFKRAQLGLAKTLGLEHPTTIYALTKYAGFLENNGKLAEAEAIYQQMLSTRQSLQGESHNNTLIVMNALGVLLLKKRDYQKAEALFRRVLDVFERTKGPEHRDTLTVIGNLSSLLSVNGDYAEAEHFYRRSLDVFKRMPGPDFKDVREARSAYRQLIFDALYPLILLVIALTYITIGVISKLALPTRLVVFAAAIVCGVAVGRLARRMVKKNVFGLPIEFWAVMIAICLRPRIVQMFLGIPATASIAWVITWIVFGCCFGLVIALFQRIKAVQCIRGLPRALHKIDVARTG